MFTNNVEKSMMTEKLKNFYFQNCSVNHTPRRRLGVVYGFMFLRHFIYLMRIPLWLCKLNNPRVRECYLGGVSLNLIRRGRPLCWSTGSNFSGSHGFRARSAWGGSLTSWLYYILPQPTHIMPFLLSCLQSLSPPEKPFLDHLATWFNQFRHQKNA